MLRPREFDQRDADGDRPRRWVALSRLGPLSRRIAAPLLSPRRRSHCFPRQLQTPRSTPLTVSVAKNALGDRTPATTKFSSRQKSLDVAAVSQNSTTLEVANKNALAGLANMADLAASQKSALFHPPRRPQHSVANPSRPRADWRNVQVLTAERLPATQRHSVAKIAIRDSSTPPPSKGWEQVSTGDPKSPVCKAVEFCEAN